MRYRYHLVDLGGWGWVPLGADWRAPQVPGWDLRWCRLRPSFQGRVKLGAAEAQRDRPRIDNKKPRPRPGLLLGAAGSVVAALVKVLVNEAELGPFVKNVERGLELL